MRPFSSSLFHGRHFDRALIIRCVRFWIGGEGFIRTLPIAQSAAFDWTPVSSGTLTVHAQLIAGETPVSRTTEPVWFDPATGQPINPLVADWGLKLYWQRLCS